jgi:hypothetical protein
VPKSASTVGTRDAFDLQAEREFWHPTPFLVAAMGFAALLMAAGLLTLRSGVFARWVGIVALLGAISFLITFLALIAGLGEDSVFGFGFFPGVLALVIWSIATSIARYRAVATRDPLANEAGT